MPDESLDSDMTEIQKSWFSKRKNSLMELIVSLTELTDIFQ
jgi:hypothetical protein